jgi:beta-xylosidase
MGIKPFVELGFTPDAMKTSDRQIFYWKGNTSHPIRSSGPPLVDAFVRHLQQRYGKAEVRSWYLRSVERAEPRRLLGKGRPEGLFRALRPDVRAPSRRSTRR